MGIVTGMILVVSPARIVRLRLVHNALVRFIFSVVIVTAMGGDVGTKINVSSAPHAYFEIFD